MVAMVYNLKFWRLCFSNTLTTPSVGPDDDARSFYVNPILKVAVELFKMKPFVVF
jgi:hypothetical protein